MAQDDLQPSDNDEDNTEEWPELSSIAAIIHRARIYAAKHHCSINLAFHVEITGITSDQVKEKFIFSGSPDTGTDPESPEYKKALNDIKDIVTEEMQAAFHGSVEDLDSRELEGLMEDVKPELKRPADKKKPNDGDSPFMNFKRLTDG